MQEPNDLFWKNFRIIRDADREPHESAAHRIRKGATAFEYEALTGLLVEQWRVGHLRAAFRIGAACESATAVLIPFQCQSVAVKGHFKDLQEELEREFVTSFFEFVIDEQRHAPSPWIRMTGRLGLSLFERREFEIPKLEVLRSSQL